MDDGISGATVQDITRRGPFRVTQNPRSKEPARLRVGNLPLIRRAPAAAHPHAAGRRVEAGRRVSGGLRQLCGPQLRLLRPHTWEASASRGGRLGPLSVPHCPGLRGSERRAAGATQLWRETEAQT